jgi:phenylacetate-CoA ligase
MTGDYFDPLETQSNEQREGALFAALPPQLAHAKANTTYYASALAAVDPAAVTSRELLARLPVTRKSALIELQRAAPPFGGLTASALPRLGRVFASPGPIYDPEGRGKDYWRMARALYAAGIRPGELIHNTFSYHFTPAGAMLESGAFALGCPVFPAGVGQTEQQVAVIRDLRPAAYCGTPSFLKIILDKAAELGVSLDSLRHGLVSGEALPPSLRSFFVGRGLAIAQCYASADLGLIAYESEAREGLIVDEWVIVEIVRPGTGDPVPEGEVGEVLVTTFNRDYPLLRFATGDLSAVLPGVSPCGRTNMRIKGWLGRADQTTKVKGMFVHPSQIADVMRRHPELVRARLLVSGGAGEDQMQLLCETSDASPQLAAAVAASLREVTKLRGDIVFKQPGELPNDGKVIEDSRKYN